MDRSTPRARLEQELIGGEQIVWSGHPNPVAVFFAHLWCWAIAIVLLRIFLFLPSQIFRLWFGPGHSGLREIGVGVVLSLLGTFIFGGFILKLFSTPVRTALSARRTIYAVTNWRLMALTIDPRIDMKSADRRQIGPVTRRRHWIGRDSLKIQTHSMSDGKKHQTRIFEFTRIPDAEHVEQLVNNLCDGQPQVRDLENA